MGTIEAFFIRLLARAEQKKATLFFFLRFLHASDGCECAIVKHVIKWCLYSKVLFTF